jgi:protein-tyrosine phosphatase
MFSIFKKRTASKTLDLSAVKTDMHSHLLPGIDDGSPDTEQSIVLISGLQNLGLQNFITTPHIMWDMYKNTNEIIIAQEKLLKQSIGETYLRAAAEYYLDEHLDDLLLKKSTLLTIQDNKVLVEFSFVSMPLNWKDSIFNLQLNGYQPILAHPERYTYLARDKKIYDELKSLGCLFQLNLLSLTGYYNKAAMDLAHYLLDKKYINLVGTDMHHTRHLEALQNAGNIMPVINKLLDSGVLLNPSLVS